MRAFSSVKMVKVHDKMTMLEVKTKIAFACARKVGRISNLPNVGQLDPAQMKIYYTDDPPYHKVEKREKLFSLIDGWRILANSKTVGDYKLPDQAVIAVWSKHPMQ